MTEGAGSGPALWAAQTEMARQISANSERIGQLTAQLADRPTYKDMMGEMNGARKEITGKIDHMESKFDQSTTKLEAIFDNTIKRLQDTWETVADRAVTKEMEKRDAQARAARDEADRYDKDMERKIRNANRTGTLGVGTGILGINAAVIQYLYGAG